MPATSEEMQILLDAAYQAEVEYRGRKHIEDPHVSQAIRAFAEAVTADDYKCGIILCGLPGNGKTTLLNAFQNVVNLLNSERTFGRSVGIKIVPAREITSSYRDYDKFLATANYELLGIDDLGEEPAEILDYGNTVTPMVELLEKRYDKQLFTVITTNLTPKGLSEKYGQRIRDRFNEMMRVITFDNGSFRR